MLPIVFGVLWLNHPYFYGIAVVSGILIIWMVRPRFHIDTEREIAASDAPLLFAELDSLRQAILVKGRMKVRLDASFNASALETRGLFGLIGSECILTLGVPLLLALSREQVLAVVAHEFGHFSRRHGRLGHWLYRTRIGWLTYAEQVRGSEVALDRAAAVYAEWFIPYFTQKSFAHSQRCEYEADADAAMAVGSAQFADALTRVAVFGRVWSDGFVRIQARLQEELIDPPADFYDRFVAALRSWPADELNDWLRQDQQHRTQSHDTHPALPDRLAAIGEEARFTGAEFESGSALLGSAWPALLTDFNEQWRVRNQWDWQFAHLRFIHVLRPLLNADSATVQSWSVAQRLARAKAVYETSPQDGVAELAALHADNLGNADVTLAYGLALLDSEELRGVSLLQEIATAYPTMRLPVYAALEKHFRCLDETEYKRWALQTETAVQRRWDSVELLNDDTLTQAVATSLPRPALQVIAEMAQRDQRVAKCWLLESHQPLATRASKHAADLTIHVLVLTVDPEKLEQNGSHAEAVQTAYWHGLKRLVEADEEVIVRTYYTTESLASWLAGRAELSASR